MSIEEAEGYGQLSMWIEAWGALNELAPDEQVTPRALRLKLHCCPPLGAWEAGEALAAVLREGEDEDQEKAADFYQARAVLFVRFGKLMEASEAVKTAVRTWPFQRQKILSDPQLAKFFDIKGFLNGTYPGQE